jgi:nicotinamide-nucleotide amidase
MLEGVILPELQAEIGPQGIVSRVLRVTGIPEARIGEILDDVFRRSGNPTVAYLASAGEVRVRLTAKAASREEADALIAPVEREVRDRLGDAVFGSDEDELEEVVGALLRDRGYRLACAESLTGGGLAERIVRVPDSSDYFAGAVVAYAADAKTSVLGVSKETLEGPGMVSGECAREMARGIRKAFDADVGVSTTGVAGPSPLEGHPPGEVWVAVSSDRGEESRHVQAPGDREQVRRWAQQVALDLVRRHLTGLPRNPEA